MSVQIPETSFKYDGKIFQLLVTIGVYNDILMPISIDEKMDKFYTLTNANIEKIEYVNEFNQLYMSGSIIYKDVDGYVTNFLNRPNVEVIIDLKQILVVEDGDISIQNVDTEHTFYHEFLVNNIEILNRQNGILTYKLKLISKHFNALIKTLHYSNYNKEPEKITDILKKMFKLAASGFGEMPAFSLSKKFEEDENQSNVKMNYITNGNDNLLTITKFLLSRMFYYCKHSKESADSAIKMLLYDQYYNTFDLFDLSKTTDTELTKDTIIVSMFNTLEEDLTYADANQFATIATFPWTKYKKQVFGTYTYDYDLTNNFIIQDYVSQQTITDYHDNVDASYSDIDKQTKPTSDSPQNPDFVNQQPYWNNSYCIYDNMVQSLLNLNSLIVSTGPNIRRIPSYEVFVAIPPDKTNITTDDKNQYKSITSRYGQFQGMWIIGKVRNIIFPAKEIYRQNLVLFKNFLTKKAEK